MTIQIRYLQERVLECDELINANPNNHNAYYVKAKRLLCLEILTKDRSCYERALACYNEAIKLNEISRYLIGRARLYIHIHKPKEAVEDLIRINELSDDSSEKIYTSYVQNEKKKLLQLEPIQDQIKQLHAQGKITDAIFNRLKTEFK